jgi:hypothetical protein
VKEKGEGKDDGQKEPYPSQFHYCLRLVFATLGGHPCQTEHLQRLVERRAPEEDGEVVAVEAAFEGGSLHRD